MTNTAQKMADMVQNKQAQKARFWLRSIAKRHGKPHAQKLGQMVKELLNNDR